MNTPSYEFLSILHTRATHLTNGILSIDSQVFFLNSRFDFWQLTFNEGVQWQVAFQLALAIDFLREETVHWALDGLLCSFMPLDDGIIV